jgi:hypothetical protein
MTTRYMAIVAALLTVFATALARADEPPASERGVSGGYIELDPTVISGSQELPRVLYIVPWHQPGERPSISMAPGSDAGAFLEPIDPNAYRRELEYFEKLNGTEARK